MRSASRLFYLSVFSLWATTASCAEDAADCPISSKSIVGDACASYATLEKLNTHVKPAVEDLTHTTDFFSHYRLNLFHKRCPFWNDENGMCGNIGCAVETLENEEDIPDIWRAHSLSKLEGPRAQHPGKDGHVKRERPLGGGLGEKVGESCVFEYDDECDERDYCVPEDESAGSKGDYVSLVRNPERFTGYAGDGARQVWESIYRENCFQKSSFPHSANLGSSQFRPSGPAAQGFKQVLDKAGRQQQLEQQRQQNPKVPFVASTGFEVDDECLEKRVFYRVMSGLHASISSHLCWNFLNQTTGEWQPNLACYEHRLHNFSDRISNVYFNYALMTRAVAKLGPYLRKPEYQFCLGDAVEDATTRAKAVEVTDRAASVPQIFDESLMFVNGEGPSLKEDFRNRFRNVSRLMDCVGCDKCRLWGKLQTAGYGTALKILFEIDNNSDDIPVLKRTELVALFNTYARISNSLYNLGQFRKMIEERDSEAALQDADATTVDEQEKEEKEPEDVQKPVAKDEKKEEATEDKVDEDFLQLLLLQKRGPKSRAIRDKFRYELDRMYWAIRIVLKGWIRGPKVMWRIFRSESMRLFQAWLGLPVEPRWWKLGLPNMGRDEL